MSNLTEAQIAELKAAAEKATPGQWVSVDGILEDDDDGNSRSYIKPVPNEGWQIAQTCGPNGEANAKFIALCREAVPALIAERDRLREALKPRPIEEAPKDGRGLLLISGNWYVAGSWHKTANCWINSGPTYERLPADEQPTHFIPLSALTSLENDNADD